LTVAREPITIIEIDLPLCSRVYGTAPCTAALSADMPNKCFNTRATCQDTANYNGVDTQTLRLSKNQSGLPKGQTIFPALQSVSTRAAEINLSGIDPRTMALGKRARVTVNLLDFTYSDTFTDPYQSQRVSGAAQNSGVGYDPKDRGTFFGKLAARQPYYIGKALRVKRGYVGDTVASMSAANYVITAWDGPDAKGNVQISAADVLDLADNAKAVAPAASNGKLLANMTDIAMAFTLTPTGIGDAEYPASGTICIGRETMTFTRVADAVTIVARATLGTIAEAHSANDVAQVCLTYTDARPCDVIEDLLQTYAGVPSSYIATATWQAENDRWLGSIRMNTTITKPTGVATLVGEICQHGVLVWWDETAQQIRFKANRPLDIGETAYTLTDDANLITGSNDVGRGDDLRITALYFWHGMIDPTDDPGSDRNYTRLVISTVTEDLYQQDSIKTIVSRWFGQSGDDAAATSIANHLKNRYQTTPIILTGSLDVKDKAGLALGGIVNVTSRLLQDATGRSNETQMQISYLEEKDDRLMFKAESSYFTGRYGLVTESGRANFAGSTAAERAKGTYIVSASSLKFGNGSGAYILY
jgi:hypothetical protein